MTADSTTVEIVNTNQVEEQRLVVQGGAYGEHKIVSAATDGGGAHEVDGPCLKLRLAPGAGTTLTLAMQRWAYDPSFAFPWDR